MEQSQRWGPACPVRAGQTAGGEGRVNPSPFSASLFPVLAPGALLAGWGGDWRSGELHLQ